MRTALLAALLLAAPALAGPPRFALAVGSNHGSKGKDTLWFAERDAERLAATLTELGGFAGRDVEVLKSPTLEKTRAALARVLERAAAAGGQALVVFYYSGHADGVGLELGDERLGYQELKGLLSGAAGARVAVLDACFSGALTQLKGAKPAPLDFEVPQHSSSEGLAIITSSSATEAAQESASLAGSFFTHHLTAGLRGAADQNRDGFVTLDEAYRYAYHHTLSSTAAAGVIPQHPTYAIKMAGRGELVLVDLRQAQATLRFSPGAGRRYLVSRASTADVVAEVATGEQALAFALPAGSYRVERLAPAPRLSGEVTLAAHQALELDDRALEEVQVVAAREKGGEVYRTFLSVGGMLATPVLLNFGPNYGVGVGARHRWRYFALGGSILYTARSVDDAGVPYFYQAGTFLLSLGIPLDLGRTSLLFGVDVGLALAEQRLVNGSLAQSAIFQAGPMVGLAVPIAGRFGVRVDAGGAVHVFLLNGAAAARFSVQGRLSLELGL